MSRYDWSNSNTNCCLTQFLIDHFLIVKYETKLDMISIIEFTEQKVCEVKFIFLTELKLIVIK